MRFNTIIISMILLLIIMPVVFARYTIVSKIDKFSIPKEGEPIYIPIFFPGNGSLESLKFYAYIDENFGVQEAKSFCKPMPHRNENSNTIAYIVEEEWLKFALTRHDQSIPVNNIEIGAPSTESGSLCAPFHFKITAGKATKSGDYNLAFLAFFSEEGQEYLEQTEVKIHVQSHLERFGLFYTILSLILAVNLKSIFQFIRRLINFMASVTLIVLALLLSFFD